MKHSLTAALALALLFAGCIQIQGQVNATVLDLGRISVSVNESIQAPNESVQGIARAVVPANASVCIYGEQDERISETHFGVVRVFEQEVVLLTRWFDENTPSKNYSQCAAIVLKDDEAGKFVPLAHRQAVAKQMQRGAGLVVMGVGGTRASDDASVFGFLPYLQEFVPARVDVLGSKDPQLLGRATLSGTLFAAAQDTAFDNVPTQFSFEGWTITFVVPSAGAEAIAWIRAGREPTPTAPVYYAVLRHCPLTRNCGYYFSYDALAHTPSIANNTVRFLASEALGKYFLMRALPEN